VLCANDAACPGSTITTTPVTDPLLQACARSSDCGADGSCEKGMGDEKFCIEPCGANDACPTGYSCIEKFGDKYCKPTHGSCRNSTCDLPQGAANGQCVVPTSAYAEVCSAGAECTTKSCAGGLCSKSAERRGLRLHRGRHGLQPEPVPARRRPHPRERGRHRQRRHRQRPAPPAPSLQGLRGAAGRGATGQTRDKDVYKVTLTANTKLDIISRGVCGVGAPNLDTQVRLLDDQGAELETGSSAIDYATIVDFLVPASGQYFIEVSTTPSAPRCVARTCWK